MQSGNSNVSFHAGHRPFPCSYCQRRERDVEVMRLRRGKGIEGIKKIEGYMIFLS